MDDNFDIDLDNDMNINIIDDINIDNDNIGDNKLLGIDLLVDPNKVRSPSSSIDIDNINLISEPDVGINMPEYNNTNNTNNNESNNNQTNTKSIPLSDPILNNIIEEDDDEFKPIHSIASQDIKNEKIDFIYKFKKLESQGIRTTMNYNMNSHLDDMRNEYTKLKKQRELENSVKFQRKMLMACITGMEFLNGRFDPFNVKLDGWSESVNENLNDYDEVFEELAEKYSGPGETSPELKLLFMLGGSAFMFHLTNTMFKTSLPGMDQIFSENPELKKQFASAAMNSMPQNNKQSQNGGGGMPNMMNMMSGFMSGGNAPSRSEMNPPKEDLDDIINQMNLDPNNIDLDAISLNSGDSRNDGITLNI